MVTKTDNKKPTKNQNPKETTKTKAEKSVTKSIKGNLSIPLYDIKTKKTSNIEVPDELFKVKASRKLLSTYVRVYLTNKRQSSAVTKTRSEVVASTRKIYRQKGTGRARHGAKSAPIFVGGGVAHGPKLRKLSLKMNKKQKTKALLFSLSRQLVKNNLIAISNYQNTINKTKLSNQLLKDLNITDTKSCFVYDSHHDNNIQLYFRNLENVRLSSAYSLNAYLVAISHKIIFTEQGLKSFIKLRQQSK